jgi:hypothetical protein
MVGEVGVNVLIATPRMRFQYTFFFRAPDREGEPNVLNVGSCDDPILFGEKARHVDLDDWSYCHKYFTQANAEKLPFEDQTYHTVILGDILEHVVDWRKAVDEAARVTANTLCLTIFEEWRLPGPGQFIAEAAKLGDIESQMQGARDRMDWQSMFYPRMGLVDDNEIPHLVHINAFTDADIAEMIEIGKARGLKLIHCTKEQEESGGPHTWFNWFVAMEREVTNGKENAVEAAKG